MFVVQPVVVTPSTLDASDVPITETEWAAGTYTIGQQRYVGTTLYEVVVASTTDEPTAGAAKPEPTWVRIGAINRFRMFDRVVGAPTVNAGQIEVEITPGQIVNAIAFFGLQGQEVRIEVEDPVDGVVYDRTVVLIDNSGVINWFEYFFSDIEQLADLPLLDLRDLSLSDLPNYGTATFKITIDAGAGTAECGELVLGRQLPLGIANLGTRIGIEDFSRKERDAFGGFEVVERAFARRGEFSVSVDNAAVDFVARTLSRLRATPAVWVADEGRQATLIYGYVRDWNITYIAPTLADLSLEIEGLT